MCINHISQQAWRVWWSERLIIGRFDIRSTSGEFWGTYISILILKYPNMYYISKTLLWFWNVRFRITIKSWRHDSCRHTSSVISITSTLNCSCRVHSGLGQEGGSGTQYLLIVMVIYHRDTYVRLINWLTISLSSARLVKLELILTNDFTTYVNSTQNL